MGSTLREQGKLAEALPLLREALVGQRRVLGDDHADTLATLNTLGAALWSLGKPAEAVPLLRECLDRRRQQSGNDHVQTLFAAANLGVNLRDAGDARECLGSKLAELGSKSQSWQ